MATPLVPSSVVNAARAKADAGAWHEVLALLPSSATVATMTPELVTLRGEALLRIGQPAEARTWLAESRAAIERSGDHVAERTLANLLGAAHFAIGDLDEAQRAFDLALELAQRGADDLLVARATNNLGLIANIRGEHRMALWYYHLAVPAYQRLGYTRGLAECYHNMAITFRDLGDLERADEYERRCIEFAMDAGNRRLAAMGEAGRADLCFRRRDARMAKAAAERAVQAFAMLGDAVNEADALRLLGAALTSLGRLAEAGAALDRAVMLARDHSNALIEAEACWARGILRETLGQRDGAREDAERAAALFERLGARLEQAAVRRWLAGWSSGTESHGPA